MGRIVFTENHENIFIQMILSIIVPVYNASNYLHRCIDSLLSQELNEGEYEIILINDGSKDNSLDICNEYKENYPTIFKVLSHDNQGVAFTRNRGIDEAQGDYICFVDSDDYLKPNGYRYLIDNYLEEHIDILSFWALTLDKKTKANYIENNDVEKSRYSRFFYIISFLLRTNFTSRRTSVRLRVTPVGSVCSF